MYQELPFLCRRLDKVQAMEKALFLQSKEPSEAIAPPWATFCKRMRSLLLLKFGYNNGINNISNNGQHVLSAVCKAWGRGFAFMISFNPRDRWEAGILETEEMKAGGVNISPES